MAGSEDGTVAGMAGAWQMSERELLLVLMGMVMGLVASVLARRGRY